MLAGFDTGPTMTGWCAGDGAQIPEVGVWDFEDYGDDYGALGCKLLKNLTGFYSRFRPTRVCLEAPILIVKRPGQKHGRTDTMPFLRRRYGMDFLIETFFVNKGVEVTEADLRHIKKEVTGDSTSTKEEMVPVARACGLLLPDHGEKDATDAWGAWLHEMHAFDPDISREWDQRVRKARGSLL